MADDERIAALQSEEGLEVAPGVRVRLRSLADYRQNDENPVSHTPRNLGAVIESIHKVGAARSGLSSKGKILAGNLTSEAMAEAGIEGIIEVTTDGTQWVMVNREDLTEEQEKQAAYGDQQGSFLAGWELDQVLADVEAGVDLSGLVTDFELEAILGDAWAGEETGETPEAQIDKGAELAEKYGVQVGQIWQLGEHRLAVGDCTDEAVVDAVMQGEVAEYGFHDPPYGISLDLSWLSRLHEKANKPRNIAIDETISGDDGTLDTTIAFNFDNWMVWGFPYIADPEMTGWLVWDKWPGVENGGGLGNPIEMACTNLWEGFRIIRVMWGGYYRAVGEERKPHPTQKPLGVILPFIEQYTDTDNIVADYFVGSGTTLIACEKLGRRCRAIEIEPKFCAIAIQWWVDLTGKEPKLLP